MHLSVFGSSRSGLSRLCLAQAIAVHLLLTFLFGSAKYPQSLPKSRHPMALINGSAQDEDEMDERPLIDGILLQRCTARFQSDWQVFSSKRKPTEENTLSEEVCIESDGVGLLIQFCPNTR